MSKKFIILAIIVVLIAIGIGFFIYSNKNLQNQNSYQANKTSASQNNNSSNNKSNNNNSKNKDESTSKDTSHKEEPSEEQLSTFSTNIMSSDPSRQHNIELTCNRLNGTIVKNGDTFSFYETLGPSTKEKGYLEADILDQNRKKAKRFWRW